MLNLKMKKCADVVSVRSAIENYPVVSFDLFDTLLVRNILAPRDVFQLVETKALSEGLSVEGFATNRVKAEKDAIDKKDNNVQEITLEQIYGYLKYNSEVAKKLCDLELKAERLLLSGNREMIQLANELIANGVRVIVVSDMYMPAWFLEDVLSENGLTPAVLYVSSEVGLRKSRGDLFKYVLEKEQIAETDIIHIGDNIKSDYIVPAFCGISSVLYKPIVEINKVHNSLAESVSAALSSHSRSFFLNNYSEIGYEKLGPLLVGMAQWIHGEHEKNPAASLNFLSRDGFIVEKAYKILYPNASTFYTYVSRRSLTVPLLEKAENFNEVNSLIPYLKRQETMSSLLKKLGLDTNELIESMTACYGDAIDRSGLLSGKYDKLFEDIAMDMHDRAHEERIARDGYLAQVFSDDAILVDIGWYGTIQTCLESVCSNKFKGLYLGLLKHTPEYSLGDAEGYIYDYRRGDHCDSSYIFAFNGLIETFFSAPHGSTKFYKKAGQSYEPVFEEQEIENLEALNNIHEGALEFVKDYSCIAREYDLGLLSPEHSYNLLERLLISPTSSEVDLLGGLYFYDASYDRLVGFDSVFAYIKNPRKGIRDFLSSNWKIGFLKKVFKGKNRAKKMYSLISRIKR